MNVPLLMASSERPDPKTTHLFDCPILPSRTFSFDVLGFPADLNSELENV